VGFVVIVVFALAMEALGRTIDRARFGRTWIQAGTKIDNLVQIAHNVVVGKITEGDRATPRTFAPTPRGCAR